MGLSDLPSNFSHALGLSPCLSPGTMLFHGIELLHVHTRYRRQKNKSKQRLCPNSSQWYEKEFPSSVLTIWNTWHDWTYILIKVSDMSFLLKMSKLLIIFIGKIQSFARRFTYRYYCTFQGCLSRNMAEEPGIRSPEKWLNTNRNNILKFPLQLGIRPWCSWVILLSLLSL